MNPQASVPERATPFVSVVTPVFNEAAHIADFIGALEAQLRALGVDYEIVAVDDGSRDDSARRAYEASPAHAVRVIRFSRNFGKEAAMSAGLEFARGDVVVILDSDFQHPIEMIEVFLDRWREGYDMVYGVRESPDPEGVVKRSLRSLFYRYIGREEGISLPPNAGDFRLLDRKAVDALNRFAERDRMMKGLFAWLGFRQIGVPYRVAPRASGASNYNFRRLYRLAATGITSFSALPLQLFGVAGLAVSLLAFLYGGWIVFEALFLGQRLPGFATLAAGLMFFGGLQLVSVAVLGAYVSRIYREVKGRPLYIVEQTFGFERPRAVEARRSDARA